MAHKTLERVGRPRPGYQKVQIADRLLAAPQASDRLYLFETPAFRQVGYQFVRRLRGEAQQESARSLAVLRDRFEHLFFELRAHARQLAQFFFPAQALQFVNARNLEMLVYESDAFRPQALNLEQ